MEIKEKGQVIFEIDPVEIGQIAPNFTLNDLNNQPVTLANLLNRPVILSIFPDINTRVCSLQTRRFNQLASQNSQLNFLSISNNTKAEQEKWCAAEGVEMTILHDDLQFGKLYGLYAKEINHLARAVYVLDTNAQIIYREVLEEITQEPDYQAALAAAENLLEA
ncbi:MAG: thiol peroxidase [Streptococcaceae bacterium]|nr:thiol peroxidase [Streptococcaceae bacterium]